MNQYLFMYKLSSSKQLCSEVSDIIKISLKHSEVTSCLLYYRAMRISSY